MTLMDRRRALMGSNGKTPLIPKEYQQVEWVGSDGTDIRVTYIQLPAIGYSPGAEGRFFHPNVDIQSLIYTGYSNYFVIDSRYYNGFGCKIGNSNFQWFGVVDKNREYTFSLNADGNGTVLWRGNTYHATIGTTPSSGSPRLALVNGGKVYEMKFYENAILKNHLIPCYRKSDGVIGFYDLVTQSFRRNSGSGTLTKGGNV